MTMRALLCLMALAVAMGTPPDTAEAHAFLLRSEPTVGNTVREGPRQVHLWFSEPVEPAFSGIDLTNGTGTALRAQNFGVVAGHPDQMTVDLPPLGPGTYRVSWHVVSVDTHATEGSFTFTVKP
jgi:methionine-rich copper-binding protein CopC